MPLLRPQRQRDDHTMHTTGVIRPATPGMAADHTFMFLPCHIKLIVAKDIAEDIASFVTAQK